MASASMPTKPGSDASKLVEIRSYALHSGKTAEFHALMTRRAVPMARSAGMDVVAWGASLDGAGNYYLIRCFDGEEHRRRQQDRFYTSIAWQNGPRGEMLACIASYVDVVVRLSPACVQALRSSLRFADGGN